MFSTFLKKANCQSAAEKPEIQEPGLVSALVPRRAIGAAATATPDESCEFASTQYFALCGLGGNNTNNKHPSTILLKIELFCFTF